MKRLRVLLLSPPLSEPAVPNLAIELLAAAARRQGHAAETMHAALLQPPLFTGGLIHGLVAPTVFVPYYFGVPPGVLVEEAAVAAVADATAPENRTDEAREHTADLVLEGVRQAEQCVADIAAAIPPGRFDVIGFSVGFDAQKLPAAAIAKALRDQGETALFVAGGTGCDGPMGQAVLERFPEFDLVLQGEADSSWVHLLDEVAAGRPPHATPGCVYRVGDSFGSTPEAMVDDVFAEHPPIDYSSFIAQREVSAYRDTPLVVLFESSRGCWWGRRRHCTFCGIRSVDEEYRVRAATSTIDHVTTLWENYRPALIYATDAIAPNDYDADVWPALAERHAEAPWRLFYESKSNLKRFEMARFAAAGVAEVQPGIESLSSNVLRLMRKGATALQQVAFLKWAQTYRLTVRWGLILGTPGETAADIHAMAALVDRLSHLAPPVDVNRLVLHRFSPHFDDPASFGIEAVRPFELQRVIYRAPDELLERLCYQLNFTTPSQQTDEVVEASRVLRAAVDRWKKRHAEGATLSALSVEEARLITIADDDGARIDVVSEPAEVYVLDASAEVVSTSRLVSQAPVPEAEVRDAIARLEARGLLAVCDEAVLALPVPMDADARVDGRNRSPARRRLDVVVTT